MAERMRTGGTETTELLREVLSKQDEVLGRVLVVDARQTSTQNMVSLLDARVSALETKRVSDVERERDELKTSRTHWVRYVVTVLVSLITGGGLVALARMMK